MKKPMNATQMSIRVFYYLAGLFILAFGVNFSVNSQLGISPVSSFPYAISQVLAHHGLQSITFGNCVTIVFCVYVIIQAVLLRREFKLLNLLQIVVSTVFGWFVDLTGLLMNGFAIPTYAGRLCMLAISIVLIAVGISFYLGAAIVPMPGDGLGLAITQKLKKYPYHKVKVFVDCVYVSLAVIVSLVGTGQVLGVREGTIATALLVGPVMGILRRWINPLIDKTAFGGTGAQPEDKPGADEKTPDEDASQKMEAGVAE